MSNNQFISKAALDSIFRILTEEVSLYENMVQTVSEKQTAIIENNVSALNRCTGMEQSCIKKGNLLTSTRLEKTSIKEGGRKPKLISLTAFLEQHHLTDNAEWTRLESRLTNALTRIKRVNMENAMLLKTSVGFVQDMIKLIYPKKESDTIYNKEGKTHRQNAAVIDCGV